MASGSRVYLEGPHDGERNEKMSWFGKDEDYLEKKSPLLIPTQASLSILYSIIHKIWMRIPELSVEALAPGKTETARFNPTQNHIFLFDSLISHQHLSGFDKLAFPKVSYILTRTAFYIRPVLNFIAH